MANTNELNVLLHQTTPLTLKEKVTTVYHLSLPAILAQISDIIMQYIDAAMLGVLGASASAAVGLVASSTWLFGGIIMATAAGFSVQIAHAVGSNDLDHSARIFKQSLLSSLLLSIVVSCIGMVVSQFLPMWLGADASIWKDASDYFFFYAFFIPFRQISMLCMNSMQCAGNMKTPSLLSVIMCALDVIYNFFLIFPSRTIALFGMELWIPGAGLGVLGAQLGTSFAVVTVLLYGFYRAAFKEEALRITKTKGHWMPRKEVLQKAFSIGLPMALEQTATSGAQVVSTAIVAPLGTIAIAANSFAVTAESICYMPGYGIASASTTMVGQAIGAKRKDLTKSFAWLTVAIGVFVQTFLGIVMFFICPYVFQLLTPDVAVQQLGAQVLRIELLAEPLFAASIVATGALRGAGDTFIPGILNLVSIWGVRITLAYFLSRMIGLPGVWIAMAVELCFRGILFLIRLKREKWLQKLT